MAIKERKQITGTTAQIDAYAGHEGQIVWDKEKKTFVGMSGTAGKNYPLAPQAYVDEGLEGKEDKGTCLPKSGGTLLGGWVNFQSFDGLGTAQIVKHDTGSEYSGVDILPDISDIAKGATLSLRAKDSSVEAGKFILKTGGNPNANYLIGAPDGSITWRGQELVRIGGGSPRQYFVIGSSGAAYTAPFTGKCCIAGPVLGSGGNVEIRNNYTADHCSASTLPGVGWVRAQVYVRKGDTVTIFHYNCDFKDSYWIGS